MGKHEIYVNKYGEFECRVQWANWPVSVILTNDDDNPETAESAAALFERVFDKREYWLMLAYHQLKVKLIEDMGDDYEDYASAYRRKDSFDLPFTAMKYSFFNELLAETELSNVFFGTEGEILFKFYSFSRNCYYDVSGTETEGLTTVECSDDREDY